MPPHSETSKGDNARRGQPLGVAILSKFPTRPPRLPIEDPYFCSCRFQETWIKVHSINLCVIVIYAFTDAHPNSREKTVFYFPTPSKGPAKLGPSWLLRGTLIMLSKIRPKDFTSAITVSWILWNGPVCISPQKFAMDSGKSRGF